MLTPIIVFALLIQTAATPASEPANEPDWISPSAETVEVRDFSITLAAGEVRHWVGGNRLVINDKGRVQLLPGSYVPGSLVLKGVAGEKFETPRDYLVDDHWGAFAITSSGQLKAGQQVHATYRFSLRRVDAVVMVGFWRQYTKSLGIPLADPSRRWEQLEDLGIPYEIYLRNGINHPDERGHQIYVEELMRYFAP